MDFKTLSHSEPAFTIPGREDKMSVEILSVTLKDPVNDKLRLTVLDENGFLLYIKQLIPEPKHPNAVLAGNFPEIAVNKRFIFNNELTVKIESPEGMPFTVEVQYV